MDTHHTHITYPFITLLTLKLPPHKTQIESFLAIIFVINHKLKSCNRNVKIFDNNNVIVVTFKRSKSLTISRAVSLTM